MNNSPVHAADFLGRVEKFLSVTDPIWILIALAGAFFMVVLALFGRRSELLAVLIACATFSGAMWAQLDTGSTIVRWFILVLLTANILRLRVSPGKPLGVFCLYVAIGIACIPFSDTLVWSIQGGGLLVLATLSGIAVSDLFRTRKSIQMLLFTYIAVSILWLGLGSATLGELIRAGRDVGRHSGAIKSAPLFVITGGLLLPIVTWGALNEWKLFWRGCCAVLALCIVLLLLASGQRAGTFAGILGTLPVIFQRKAHGLALVAFAVMLVGLASVYLVSMNERQATFLKKRFTDTGTSGRTEIWINAINECMKSPIIGRGHGGERAFGEKYHKPTHNAYLSVWYNTGLPGLALFLGAYGVGLYQSLRMFRMGDRQIRGFGAVFMGILLAQLFAGMFETQTSPSNFSTITLIVVLGAIGRLALILEEEKLTLRPRMSYAMPGARGMLWVPMPRQTT